MQAVLFRVGYQKLFCVLAGLFLILSSCSSTRKLRRYLDRELNVPAYRTQFTGVLMIDADSRDTLVSVNARKGFTPASNMKLFTLYASLKLLPERIPALKYAYRGDTLVIAGTGDPSALHPELHDSTALKLIQKAPFVAMINSNLASPPFGSGWAWDDYDQYYQPQRSAFPIHGNVVRWIGHADSVEVSPQLFKDSLKPGVSNFKRSWSGNEFFINLRPGDTLDIPFYNSPELERRLWGLVSGKSIKKAELPQSGFSILPGIASDSLYARLMKESDNFIAEQLMLLVASTFSDTLSFERARDTVLGSWLKDLPQEPRWVDASGLSRYNLVSPETLVSLLQRLYREYPRERLFGILAEGGGRGTLRRFYGDRPKPYLFGKTGSLSNNHNLSGYLVTQSGKTVIFAFMNNHYQQPTSQVQFRMQRLLKWVRDHY